MAENCLTLGCPEVIRLAKVDPCSGLADRGDGNNGYALSCIRNWSIEPITREGDTAEFASDCGSVVARDKQDDQLLGYTISFETSVRSNELEALLTAKELISDGTNNIGTYGIASSVGCATEDVTDPRFTIEAFYKLSKCLSGANHIRVVLPMAQFKVTELDREGSLTFYRFTAETSIAPADSFESGPYMDFPADVTAFLAARADEYTTGFDFEENIDISGSCGSIELPSGEGFTELFEGSVAGNYVDIQTDSESRYIVGYNFSGGDGRVTRYDSGGRIDEDFGTAGTATISLSAGVDRILAIAVDTSDNSTYVYLQRDVAGVNSIVIVKLDDNGDVDADYGTAGVATVVAGEDPVSFIAVETTGEVVASYYDSGATTSHVVRLDTDGAVIDNVPFASDEIILAGTVNGGDGLYAFAMSDASTGDAMVGTIDLDTSTVDSAVLPTNIDLNTVVANQTTGDIFLGGAEWVGGDMMQVVKVDNTLAPVGAFGTAGYATFGVGAWTAADVGEILLLSGGQILVAGHATQAGTARWITARLTNVGAVVGTYGTAGIQESAVGEDGVGRALSAVLQESSSKMTEAGYGGTGADTLIVARTNTTTGALDTTFG